MTQSVDLANAINTFVKGCKTDGTWDAIKACCIMAAWDGLDGALYPLKGTAPTNYNFVSGDYNRETGLVGDGSTKYLDSNRNNNADPQNNQHMAVYITTGNTDGAVIGAGDVVTGATHIVPNPAVSNRILYRNRSSSNDDVVGQGAATGFVGMSRASSTVFSVRSSSSSTTFVRSSATPATDSIRVFARSATNFSAARLSFYSIGEALDLALLDNRVSTLMTDIGAAIP